MKYTISSTIPVVQYGNIIPSIEAEVDSLEEGFDLVMPEVKKLWAMYAEKPLVEKVIVEGVDVKGKEQVAQSLFRKVKTFTGETILYDDLNHKYTDLNGNELISATTYKKRFEKEFPLDLMAEKVAKKNGLAKKDILDMWARNGEISRGLGTAVHQAMEQYWKHRGHLCEGKEYHLPKNPTIRSIVEAFPSSKADKDFIVLPEVFVSNIAKKMVGQIDAVYVIDEKKKICELWDYKSDAEMVKDGKLDKPKLKMHFIQMSFYGRILELAGWTVKGLTVWNWDGSTWTNYSQEPFDLAELKKEQEDKVAKSTARKAAKKG